MHQRDNNFFLPKENQDDALQFLKSLDGKYAWVNGREVSSALTLYAALRAWRWEAEFDKDGNINAIYFEGEKSGDDLALFNAIAPFVKAGSFIEMSGEDGAIWRFQFDGKICFENYPTISWD